MATIADLDEKIEESRKRTPEAAKEALDAFRKGKKAQKQAPAQTL